MFALGPFQKQVRALEVGTPTGVGAEPGGGPRGGVKGRAGFNLQNGKGVGVLWAWVKSRYPKMEPTGKWKQGLKHAAPGGLVLTHTHMHTFHILSRDPSFQETIKNPGEADPVFEERTMVEKNGIGINP